MLLRKKAVEYEPLGIPHRGLALVDPNNPVVFLDIQKPLPRAVAGTDVAPPPGGSPAAHTYRFQFELFHHVCPQLSKNFLNLCIGGVNRVVDLRPQPAGFKGTSLLTSVPGQFVAGGDVLHLGGEGHFSAIREQDHLPFTVPDAERCAGADVLNQVRQFTAKRQGGTPSAAEYVEVALSMLPVRFERASHSTGNDNDGEAADSTVVSLKRPRLDTSAAPPPVEELKVACQFRIDVLSSSRGAVPERDGVVIGRLVVKKDDDRAAAVRELNDIARAIYMGRLQEERGARASYPTIVLCGEM